MSKDPIADRETADAIDVPEVVGVDKQHRIVEESISVIEKRGLRESFGPRATIEQWGERVMNGLGVPRGVFEFSDLVRSSRSMLTLTRPII